MSQKDKPSDVQGFTLQDVMEAIVGLNERLNDTMELLQDLDGKVDELQDSLESLISWDPSQNE